jgi:hypothetical protein
LESKIDKVLSKIWEEREKRIELEAKLNEFREKAVKME